MGHGIDTLRNYSRPMGDVHIPAKAGPWIHRSAVILGFVAVGMFVWLAIDRGAPRSTYFDEWEPPAQIALLAIASLGYLFALRWPGLGGAIIVVTAVALGVLATLEYSRTTAFLACLAFLVPGTLFLIDWQRTGSLRSLAVIVVVVAALLAIGGFASARVYSYYYGPTHPESPLESQPVDLVEWIWAGAVTDSSVTVTARLANEQADVSLLVSPADGSAEPVRSAPSTALNENDRITKLTVSGLEPATRYEYTIEADGRVEATRRGSFSTFPRDASTFTFAVASCARSGSNGSVFDTIRAHEPLFYIVSGDIHYENIEENDREQFIDAFNNLLTQPAQAALYQSTPIAYVWDDHDYGGNNSDRTAAARPAARSVYRQIVPHYDLPAGADDGAIYQTFSAGRVRFILTDARSERSPSTDPDDENKTMLGEEQKSWLKSELLAARDEYALIVWVNSDPWISEVTEGGDSWNGYDKERQEIAGFIEDHGIDNLLIAGGDAHMLAIDDGSNSAGGFPVFHAAPLDRRGSVKGGPYSEGTHAGSGQFGLVTVEDNGGSTIEVTLSGRNWEDEELLRYNFEVTVSPGRASGRP